MGAKTKAEPRPDEIPDLIPVSEVAKMVFLSESHVRRLAASGAIPSVKYGERQRLFRREDVERWRQDRLKPNGGW